MYWWQTDTQVQQEIEDTVASIKKNSAQLRESGPDACRQFLIDAGILLPDSTANS